MKNLCIYKSIETNNSDEHYIKMNGEEYYLLMEVIDGVRSEKAKALYNKLGQYKLIEQSLFDKKHLSDELDKVNEA